MKQSIGLIALFLFLAGVSLVLAVQEQRQSERQPTVTAAAPK